ncbi:GntR family transcriptional regulator [Roseateles sp. BYS96W]|uniref:GntR family transcriptional regulator n=1 Tax=Pelomonas nitida TaxID=3299027 RepID=A0ABW7G183_9BURK
MPSKAAATTDTSATSASQRIYAYLRRCILELEMPPGTRVVELDIAAAHGVSRTPVHEAVRRLAEEGLIEIVQRVGTFVSRIPVDELEEAMLVRTALEVAIVEKATQHVDSGGLALLNGLLARQRACMTEGNHQGFHEADEAFHAALADIAGCPGVWRTILQAKTQIDRFRRLTLPIAGRMAGVIEEHAAVVDALAQRQPESAKDAMRNHLDHVLPVIGATRAFRPDYFVNKSAPSPGTP